jgi:hypothetical protein
LKYNAGALGLKFALDGIVIVYIYSASSIFSASYHVDL